MWAAVPPMEQPPFAHQPTLPPHPLSRVLPSCRRAGGGEDRHSSVWLLCWAQGGKRNGSIRNVLLFGAEDATLSGRQGYQWAEHVLLSPAWASHQRWWQQQQQTQPVPVQPLFIHILHSLWCILQFPSEPTEHYINLCTHTSQVLWKEDTIAFDPSYLSWFNPSSHQLSPTWPLAQTTPSSHQFRGE